MSSAGIGFLLSASSAVLNGSFVVFSKLPSVKAAGVDPLVFQMWTSFGVFLSSLLTMPFIEGEKYPPGAIGWGILAGGIFVCAVAFSFVAVQLVGLSIGQGIWSGSAVLISFVWGVAAFGDTVNPSIAAGGLILIVIGVCLIAGCGDIAQRFCAASKHALDQQLNDSLIENESGVITPTHRRGQNGSLDLDPQLVHPAAQRDKMRSSLPSSHNSSHTPLNDLDLSQGSIGAGANNNPSYGFVGVSGSYVSPPFSVGPDPSTHLIESSVDSNLTGWSSRRDSFQPNEHDESPSVDASLKRQRQIYGCVCALVVGLFGGSILMPLQLAPSSSQGLQFVPSFGLGTLTVAPLITLPYMWLSRSSGSRGNWALKQSLIPGLLAGFVWNGANICSIYAIPRIGYAVAYPLMQCAIAVAGLWGVLVFKEIRGRQISVMAIGVTIVLGGAVLLSLSKQ